MVLRIKRTVFIPRWATHPSIPYEVCDEVLISNQGWTKAVEGSLAHTIRFYIWFYKPAINYYSSMWLQASCDLTQVGYLRIVCGCVTSFASSQGQCLCCAYHDFLRRYCITTQVFSLTLYRYNQIIALNSSTFVLQKVFSLLYCATIRSSPNGTMEA